MGNIPELPEWFGEEEWLEWLFEWNLGLYLMIVLIPINISPMHDFEPVQVPWLREPIQSAREPIQSAFEPREPHLCGVMKTESEILRLERAGQKGDADFWFCPLCHNVTREHGQNGNCVLCGGTGVLEKI